MARIKVQKTIKNCPNGHEFLSNWDDDECPKCKNVITEESSIEKIVNPTAKSLIESIGIKKIGDFRKIKESDIIKINGIGKGTVAKLKKSLEKMEIEFLPED